MNSKKVEEIAVNAVKEFFFQSDIVETYIATNDKEPIWDGHFYLYSQPDVKKENFVNRIPAQIKGKSVASFKTENFSYPIDISDLKAYKQNGIYYMVVQVLEDRSTTIFYRELTPFLIRKILRVHKGQKTANVKMDLFPESCKEAERHLFQFAHDCKMQSSFSDAEPFTLEKVKKFGINSFALDEVLPDKKVPSLIEITKKPNYIYAKVFDDIKIPLGEEPVHLSFEKDIIADVSVNDVVYYHKYKSQIKEGYVLLFIGDCLTLKLTPKENGKHGESVINLNVNHNFRFIKNAINDARFILDIDKYQQINIGSMVIKGIPKINDKSFVKFRLSALENYTQLQDTLDILHVKENLDLSLLKSKDETTIDVLISMIKNNQEVAIKADKTSIVNLQIANLHLWLLTVKLVNGKFRMFKYFDRTSGIRGYYEYPDGKFQDSIYSSLGPDDIVDCSNIYYEDVIPSYEEIKSKNPHTFERANQFGLYLLSASDKLVN